MFNYQIHNENSKYFLVFKDFNGENRVQREHFIHSLIDSQILVGASTNLQRNKLFFYAENIRLLKDFLTESSSSTMSSMSIINMIDCLSKQILYLESKNHTFYKLDIDSILVIDHSRFIIANPDLVYPINYRLPKTIDFFLPVNKYGFISPELKRVDVLPSSIPYNSVYYSLGLLVLYCLDSSIFNKGEDGDRGEGEGEGLHYNTLLLDSSLVNTKLFWFIKRCLHPNVEKRRLLFI
jgi:hypothetical protein